MKIDTLRLKNFRSFKDAIITELPRFCVVVGANGSGKSTLIELFGFLKDCLTFNVRQALQARGGFREVLSRGVEADESIGLEIKFRMDVAGVERLVTYLLEIGQEEGQVVVRREVLRYKRSRHGSPFHFLDFSRGKGYAVVNEEDFGKEDEKLERESQQIGEDTLAIKGLGQFARFKTAHAFRKLIENWHVSDFPINKARGSKAMLGEFEHLSATGDNLPLVARHIFDNHSDLFKKIVDAMKHRVPGVDGIEPLMTLDGRLILSFQDSSFKDPFIDSRVSDGTIKMFAYLVLLYDPKPHPLLCIEEPENQLYPKLLWELAEEFRAYSERGGQVFVSSHSPDFLNAVALNEVVWLAKKQGYTRIYRAKDDAQLKAFMEEGDQMGYLWKHGLFPGADPE